MEICGRDNGFSKKERKAAVLACVKGYREGMAKFADMGHLDVWYAHLDVDSLRATVATDLDRKSVKKADKYLPAQLPHWKSQAQKEEPRVMGHPMTRGSLSAGTLLAYSARDALSVVIVMLWKRFIMNSSS